MFISRLIQGKEDEAEMVAQYRKYVARGGCRHILRSGHTAKSASRLVVVVGGAAVGHQGYDKPTARNATGCSFHFNSPEDLFLKSTTKKLCEAVDAGVLLARVLEGRVIKRPADYSCREHPSLFSPFRRFSMRHSWNWQDCADGGSPCTATHVHQLAWFPCQWSCRC